jgi:hypothetical protein
MRMAVGRRRFHLYRRSLIFIFYLPSRHPFESYDIAPLDKLAGKQGVTLAFGLGSE